MDKTPYLSILRNKDTSLQDFRKATKQISLALAQELAKQLNTESYEIETPVGPCSALRFKYPPLIVPILRAGLSMLSPFESFFPDASVGFIGIERDEETAVAHSYYCKLPELNPEQ